MKNTFLIICIITLISCNNSKKDVLSLKWRYLTYDYETKSVSPKTLINNNYLYLNIPKRELKDSIQIKIIDNKIPITDFTLNKNGEIDSTHIYNYNYDVKKIDGINVLILRNENTQICLFNTDISQLNETNNFYKPINLKVENIYIGQKIEKKLLTEIETTYKNNYEAKLKSNNEINLELDNNLKVLRIERKNIDKNEVKSIIEVISRKLNMKADTIKHEDKYSRDNYKWKTTELDIELSGKSSIEYYKKKLKTENNDIKQLVYNKLISKEISNIGKYTLTIKSDYFSVQNQLSEYKKRLNKNKSIIVE